MYRAPLLRTGNDTLQIELHPEADGRWLVRSRPVDPSRALHRDGWDEYPHCSQGEAEDVVAALAESWMAAPEL